MARKRVQEINNGDESVPTIEFPDGEILTEPTTDELRQKLEELGYAVPEPKDRKRGDPSLMLSVAGLIMVVVGLFADENALIGVGIAFLLLPIFLRLLRVLL
jgi:hypothetical protein